MKKIAAAVCLVTVAVITIVLFVAWPRLDLGFAEAFVLLNRDAVSGDRQDYLAFKETQAELLQSTYILNRALSKSDLSEIDIDRARLRRALTISIDKGELIHIELRRKASWTEEQTTEILDRLVEAYVEEVANKNRLEVMSILNSCRKRYRQIRDQVVSLSTSIAQLQESLGDTSSPEVQMEYDFHKGNLRSLIERCTEAEMMRAAIGPDAEKQAAQMATLSLKIRYLRSEIAKEKEEMQRFGGASGELLASQVDLMSLQQQMHDIKQKAAELEIELEKPDKIQIVMSPLFNDGSDE